MTSETEAVARNWIVAGVVVLVLAVAGAAVALAADDDGVSAHSAPDTSSRAPTTAPATSTTAPVTTLAPDTTAAPTTTTTTSVPPVGAPPGTCGAEAGAIRAAVDAGVPGAQDRAEVAECRLAAIDASWAITRLEAKPGAEFAATTVLLHSGGAWTIVDSGTDDVGCGAAPQQVLVDLGLFCTGTGGGTR